MKNAAVNTMKKMKTHTATNSSEEKDMYIASLKEAKSLAERDMNQQVSAESFNESVEYSNRKYKAEGPS